MGDGNFSQKPLASWPFAPSLHRLAQSALNWSDISAHIGWGRHCSLVHSVGPGKDNLFSSCSVTLCLWYWRQVELRAFRSLRGLIVVATLRLISWKKHSASIRRTTRIGRYRHASVGLLCFLSLRYCYFNQNSLLTFSHIYQTLSLLGWFWITGNIKRRGGGCSLFLKLALQENMNTLYAYKIYPV